MISLFAAGLACIAPLASAYTTPTGDAPKGNPISQPGLNSIVPVDKGFTITWEPTTDGTVSLVLLKGPADNLIPVYAIAEKIENSGTYDWNPKKTLEPSEGAKGYGIQLIDDKTGQYQYTTQFGISNDDYSPKEQSSSPAGYASAPKSEYASAPASSQAAAASSAPASSASSSAAPMKSASSMNTTSATSAAAVVPAVTTAASSGAAGNNSVVQPTGSMTVPSSLKGSSTMATMAPSGSPVAHNNGSTDGIEASTGGASNMAASVGGLVIAAGVAVFAL